MLKDKLFLVMLVLGLLTIAAGSRSVYRSKRKWERDQPVPGDSGPDTILRKEPKDTQVAASKCSGLWKRHKGGKAASA